MHNAADNNRVVANAIGDLVAMAEAQGLEGSVADKRDQ
jgi:hypothetical protein